MRLCSEYTRVTPVIQNYSPDLTRRWERHFPKMELILLLLYNKAFCNNEVASGIVNSKILSLKLKRLTALIPPRPLPHSPATLKI